MDKKWVIGNWKMHGSLASNALRIEALLAGYAVYAAQLERVSMVVLPPLVYLGQMQEKLKAQKDQENIQLGAQLVAAAEQGAYTGQCSAAMLREFSVSIVLVGHSECRQYLGFDASALGLQLRQVLLQGMRPVLCIGEGAAERRSGRTQEILWAQLDVLKALGQEFAATLWERLIVAYEPVWAIGTGDSATPEYIQQIHEWIQQQLGVVGKPPEVRVPVLYGGSVSAANVRAIMALAAVSGVLVGGASLQADGFLELSRCVAETQ